MSYYILNKFRIEFDKRTNCFFVYFFGGDNNVYEYNGKRYKSLWLVTKGSYNEVLDFFSKWCDDYNGGSIKTRYKDFMKFYYAIKDEMNFINRLEDYKENKRQEEMRAEELKVIEDMKK